MRKTLVLLSALMALPAAACTYGGITAHPNGKLYVARNGFGFFAMRQLYECTPDGAGNVTCIKMEGRP